MPIFTLRLENIIVVWEESIGFVLEPAEQDLELLESVMFIGICL